MGALFTLTALGETASAFDTEVDATSAGQAYTFGSPLGALIVRRRRFLQTLALEVLHLEGDVPRPGDPEYSVLLRLRLDSDAGITPDETAYSRISSRFVPGLTASPFDMMYGYLEGRKLLGGVLGFRLGRQYVVDSLGWWSFDGAQARVITPFYFAIEAYGGLEQRGGLPLSTPRFEQNGMWRGDRMGFESTAYPQFAEAYAAPAYGVALESAGISFIHGRFDYRKVMNRGPVLASFVPDPLTGAYATYDATRVSSERIGYALDASSANLGGVKGGLVYDLFTTQLTSAYGQLDVYATERLTLGADYDYFRPTFDGDSIFTFFTHEPMTTVTGRVAWDPRADFDVALSGGARSFTTDGNPATFVSNASGSERAPTLTTDVLANLASRYRHEKGNVALRALLERGDIGRRQGGDISGERRFLGGRWSASARVSLFDWVDELRPTRSATSFAYVIGGGFRPSRAAQAMLEWEHDANRLVGQRYRILALVNLAVTK